jgi:hypothetical protein
MLLPKLSWLPEMVVACGVNSDRDQTQLILLFLGKT